MSYLDWKPEFSVGIKDVDAEHREMIELINSVYDELGGQRDADAVDRFLGDVHRAVQSHFALEERIMRESRYEEYEDHKNDHEDLLDDIRDMMDTFDEDPVAGFETLEQSLSQWFGNHFATFDARLHGKLQH
jgi:hemerythrin